MSSIKYIIKTEKHDSDKDKRKCKVEYTSGEISTIILDIKSISKYKIKPLYYATSYEKTKIIYTQKLILNLGESISDTPMNEDETEEEYIERLLKSRKIQGTVERKRPNSIEKFVIEISDLVFL